MEALFATIARIPPWAAMASIFGLAALEASLLIGLVVPGEAAMLLGGALCASGRLHLGLAIAAGSLGAILGDSIGYALGARYGESIMRGRLGRFVGPRAWNRARGQLRRRGFVAVMFGRFPPFLRTLVPLLAGIARVPYRTFVTANVTGGVVWASASVLAGYAAGQTWRHVARIHGIVGVVLLAAVLVVLAVLWVRRLLKVHREENGEAHTS